MWDLNHPGTFPASVSQSSPHGMFASEVQGAKGREGAREWSPGNDAVTRRRLWVGPSAFPSFQPRAGWSCDGSGRPAASYLSSMLYPDMYVHIRRAIIKTR